MLYAPIRLFNLGLHNYKVEIQNKQIKTFQVVLLTRPSVGGVCVCVCVCVCVRARACVCVCVLV